MKTTWHRLQVQQQYVVKFYNNKFNRRPDAKNFIFTVFIHNY